MIDVLRSSSLREGIRCLVILLCIWPYVLHDVNDIRDLIGMALQVQYELQSDYLRTSISLLHRCSEG